MGASCYGARCLRRWLAAICLLTIAATIAQSEESTAPVAASDPLVWPAVTQTARPWTRWWWLGSAVDDANITRLLEEYHQAGLGGVEITCIYGARGAEDRYLPYLSNKWRDAVRHTLFEAKRLGMGVDLPTGSGWRTGGPSVTDADANMNVLIEQESLEGGSQYKHSFDGQWPQAVIAYGESGQVLDVTNKVGDDGQIGWPVPEGKWKVFTVNTRWSRDNVKRAAPGGEGKNINPLSRRAFANYLDYFGKGIGDLPAEGIRAQFHDSYEYDGNWCDDFLAQFEKRRGYRLQDHLPELTGDASGDASARIKHDYRETVSDLIIEELIQPWTRWSHDHGMISRNQGHGSPGNWLDIYAACDIPETESFGRLVGGDGHPLVFKFASSAANVTGKPLVSSETATWIEEHFNETLGQVKEMADRLFLAGVNHVIYHGTAYSPEDAAWPGWLFYASTQLNPQNPIWRDFPALNEYITRCQSVLQSTKPDNDILLYWPIHDIWTDYKGLRKDLRVHNARDWLFDTPFGKTAQWLDDTGFTFDYVSDRQLADCRVVDKRIQTRGGNYVLVLVPGARFMPLTTLQKIVELTEAGATVGFLGDLPAGPPGMATDNQLAEWDRSLEQLKKNNVAIRPLPDKGQSPIDPPSGRRGFEGPPLLESDVIPRWRRLTLSGLAVLRRKYSDGSVYFVKNDSDRNFDEQVPWDHEFGETVLMDPLDGRTGLADIRNHRQSVGNIRMRLQLAPGQTLFVKTSREKLAGPRWVYDRFSSEATPIDGHWSVEFVAGGPELPPGATIGKPESWTKFAAPEGESFAGTARYSIKFDAPSGPGKYRLDLGAVADSAEVKLDGKPIATLFTSPFQIDVDLADKNELVVDVTNVAANRIRDLDRRKVEWRIFHDINLVSLKYGRFDASNWPIRDAGLLGPVTLQKRESQSNAN